VIVAHPKLQIRSNLRQQDAALRLVAQAFVAGEFLLPWRDLASARERPTPQRGEQQEWRRPENAQEGHNDIDI
jgi:hypothetical protein